MLRKFAPFRVPQSWYFENPENRWRIEGKSLSDLTQKVRLYRAQNEFPELDYLEAVIEHYLCGKRENIGACESRGVLKRGLIPMIKGGIVILKNMMYNSFASQEVADERAEICVTCPHNVFPDKGPFIEWSDRLAENSVGDRKTRSHDLLGNCAVCSCPLRCKTFHPGPFELTTEQRITIESTKPDCWQLEKRDD